MAAKRITERVATPFAGAKVDREKGTVSGVLICGFASANGRDYPAAVFKRDHAKYEGRPVNCDHGRESTIDRRLGWFSGVTIGTDGKPRGTLNVLTTHPMAARVFEAAERNPALFGLSHVALCETRTTNGREVVEAITAVESIDLVADPATTKGLFEGRGAGVFTLKKLAEWVAKHPTSTTKQILKAKRLAEQMDDLADAPVAMDEPGDTSDPDEAVTGGFRTAINSLVEKCLAGDSDPKECLKKIKKLLDSHSDVTGDGGGGGESDTPAEPPAEESRKPDHGVTIYRECVAAGYTPTPSELEVLALLPTPEKRKAFVSEQRAKVPGDRPQSAGRRVGGGAAGTVTEAAAPARVTWD